MGLDPSDTRFAKTFRGQKQYDPGVFQKGNVFSTLDAQGNPFSTTREDWIKGHPGDTDVFDIGGAGARSRAKTTAAPPPPAPTAPPPSPAPAPPPVAEKPSPSGPLPGLVAADPGGGGGGGIGIPAGASTAAAPMAGLAAAAPDMPTPNDIVSVGGMGGLRSTLGTRRPPSLEGLLKAVIY